MRVCILHRAETLTYCAVSMDDLQPKDNYGMKTTIRTIIVIEEQNSNDNKRLSFPVLF